MSGDDLWQAIPSLPVPLPSMAAISRAPYAVWRPKVKKVPSAPGWSFVSVVSLNKLADTRQLAVGAAARQQRITVNANLAIGVAFNIKARVEISGEAGAFECDAYHPPVTHEQDERAAATRLHPRNSRDRKALPHSSLSKSWSDFTDRQIHEHVRQH